MKILSTVKTSSYTIDIEIEFDFVGSIAAARINQLKNISKKKSLYRGAIATV